MSDTLVIAMGAYLWFALLDIGSIMRPGLADARICFQRGDLSWDGYMLQVLGVGLRAIILSLLWPVKVVVALLKVAIAFLGWLDLEDWLDG